MENFGFVHIFMRGKLSEYLMGMKNFEIYDKKELTHPKSYLKTRLLVKKEHLKLKYHIKNLCLKILKKLKGILLKNSQLKGKII